MSTLKKLVFFLLIALFLTSIASCRASDCNCPKFEITVAVSPRG